VSMRAKSDGVIKRGFEPRSSLVLGVPPPPHVPPSAAMTPAGKARIEAERQALQADIATFKRKMAIAKVEVCEHRIELLRPGV